MNNLNDKFELVKHAVGKVLIEFNNEHERLYFNSLLINNGVNKRQQIINKRKVIYYNGETL